MKKILFVLLIVSLFSCDDNDPKPVSKFVGSWAYESQYLSFYFDVVQESGVLNTVNRRVVHTGIPQDQEGNNMIQIFDEAIEITSRGPVIYYIYLVGHNFTEDGNLNVSEMVIKMPGEDEQIIVNQVLVKK